MEAFEDRTAKGWSWNNLMLQKWVDHNGVEHRVLEDYQRNVQLCDLTAQPDDVKVIIADTIANSIINAKNIAQVGVRLMKFCGEFDLVKMNDNITQYVEPFNARYPNDNS